MAPGSAVIEPMSVFQALLLGIVQGLSEFIPISSSGHLVLFPFIFGWRQPTVAFDVSLHIGTLGSLVWVFREEIAAIVRAVRRPEAPERRLLKMIVIGTIPAAVVGVALNTWLEDAFERPVVVSILLGVTAWGLLWGEARYERSSEERRGVAGVAERDALAIGAAQAVAILPGISRSGSTIVAGFWRGLEREAAVRFAFLLGIPAIAGAAVVKLPDMAREGLSGSGAAMIVGVLASAVTGVIAIRGLLRLIGRRTLRPFAAYCVFAMAAGLLTALARG